ncbi:hypothetical protein NS506_04654 [Nocardia seriolae]|uniref:HTH luxR-type domain-containing protein n=2 Tax=Nocardia seriolae TaxID=37332 RepID=A0ABC8AWV6_9NOCA|nr:LuxR family transcriptional regulator [Nocardia seriolae]APA98702.1 hypothetical protein NS506_04654 [Nocardia seriolae]
MRAWPLTGRSEELAFIETAVRRRGSARGVVLSGRPGVGKTRLAREAVALERRRGAFVCWVSATECARAVPLGAFASLVTEPGDPQTAVRRAVDRIVGGRGAAVVAVDDAHLLDDLSALLVNQLVLQGRATLVATVRSGEPVPDAVTALWKDEHLERLELQPLSERETEALVAAVLGGHVDQGTVQRLWQLSQGNVLYLRQLVASSAFRSAGGAWRLAGDVEVPSMLADMVIAHLDELAAEVRTVVDLLALSEPLPIGLLGGIVAGDAVESAEDAGVVTIESEDDLFVVRLAHPLYGEVRRASMGRLRARRLRGRIAASLADSGSRRPETRIRRAVLLLDSDLRPDPDLFIEVGERALGLADFRLADRLGRAAVGAAGGFRAQAIVAFAAMLSSPPASADAELAVLANLAGNESEFVRATVTRATNLGFRATCPDEAGALLAEAIARVTDHPLRDTLRALSGMFEAACGRLDTATALGTEVLAADDATDAAVLFASCGMVMWAAMTGRADLGAYVARGTAAAENVAEFANFRAALATQHLSGLIWAGHLDLATTVAAEYRGSVEDTPMAQCRYVTGIAGLARGELDTARSELTEERAGQEPFGNFGGALYGTLLSLTQCLAIRGEREAACRAQADMHRYRHPAVIFCDPIERLADAWVAASEGNVSAAITLAHEAAGIARGRGQTMHTAIALHTATRFGDRTAAAELAELATRLDGPRAPAAAAHAAALAADDARALMDAAAAFERFGDQLSAADALAQAADSFRRHGLYGSAHTAAARAVRIAARCGGPHTPALSLVAVPLPLSAREREVITLAAQGFTNREIAEKLMLSARTVEGHVYRASAKLGVTGRHEFAAILGFDDAP